MFLEFLEGAQFWFTFYWSIRCLTIGGTHLRRETAEAATKTATETETETEIETEGEDTGTEEHQPSHPAATETEGDEDTDRMEAIYALGGTFLYYIL